jgi:hypothetical protein
MHLLFGTTLLMRKLSGLRRNFVITYFDDIRAHLKGADARTYLDHLAQIIDRLQNAGIKLSAEKHPAVP